MWPPDLPPALVEAHRDLGQRFVTAGLVSADDMAITLDVMLQLGRRGLGALLLALLEVVVGARHLDPDLRIGLGLEIRRVARLGKRQRLRARELDIDALVAETQLAHGAQIPPWRVVDAFRALVAGEAGAA
jgi:hypothetical protein